MDGKERIRNAVLAVKSDSICLKNDNVFPVSIKEIAKCRQKQIDNVIEAYASDCRQEDMVVLVDLTILGSGKKGFLFAKDCFYADKGEFREDIFGKRRIPMPVFYESLVSVEADEKDNYLTLHYSDGQKYTVYTNVHTCYLHAVFSAILDAMHGTPEGSREGESDETAVAREAAGNPGPDPEPGKEKEAQAVPESVEEAGSQTRKTAQEGTTENSPSAGDGTRQAGSPGITGQVDTPEGRFALPCASAELGDPEEQFALGRLYEKGVGTPVDKGMALYWYEKAAEQGHTVGQIYSGNAYFLGKGTAVDYDKSLYWYEKAAAAGQRAAQYGLGRLYVDESWSQADLQKAFFWFEKAAEQDYQKAQAYCGEMCYYGKGVAEDKEKALYWYEKAAEQGDPMCQSNCGIMYYKGIGTQKNLEKAFYWHHKAAGQGHVTSMYVCGTMYYQGECVERDLAKALQWLEKAAAEGHKDAAYACGLMYRDGEGSAPDKEKALYWFGQASAQGHEEAAAAREELSRWGDIEERVAQAKRKQREAFIQNEKAAAQGDREAGYQCGMAFRKGEGTYQDEKKAFYWLEKAARAGNTEARYQCGLMYRDGKGVTRSRDMALKCFRECAMQEHAMAQHDLGILYYIGDSEALRDRTRGTFWMTQAAQNEYVSEVSLQVINKSRWDKEQGDVEESQETGEDRKELYRLREKYAKEGRPASQFAYGCILRDKEKAFYWLEQAARQGYAPAQYACGKMYQDGEGTEKNLEMAVSLYEKAASQDHRWGQYALGCMYEEGRGVPVDFFKALSLYGKAAKQGHGEAKARLDWLGFRMQEKDKLDAVCILLCSDIKFIRMVTRQHLEALGIRQIHETGDGREAVEKYGELKPDLVFVDMIMSGMSGEETMRTIADRWPDARIIPCYNPGVQETTVRHLQQKYGPIIAGYLQKPFPKQPILEILVKNLLKETKAEG